MIRITNIGNSLISPLGNTPVFNDIVVNLTVNDCHTFQTVIGMSHNTVKPIELNKKIASLFKIPIDNQKVYIPFAGVMSEYIGFILEGYNEKNIYACEINKEYIEIGKARIKYWKGVN